LWGSGAYGWLCASGFDNGMSSQTLVPSAALPGPPSSTKRTPTAMSKPVCTCKCSRARCVSAFYLMCLTAIQYAAVPLRAPTPTLICACAIPSSSRVASSSTRRSSSAVLRTAGLGGGIRWRALQEWQERRERGGALGDANGRRVVQHSAEQHAAS
jgi:hypothetical protein